MKITIRLLLVLLSLSGVSACAEAGSDSALTPDRTDRNGLIEYAVPPGWNNNDSSSGRHFKRDDPAEDQAMIYIEALGNAAVAHNRRHLVRHTR